MVTLEKERPPTTKSGLSPLIRIDQLGMSKTLGISRVATNLASVLQGHDWFLAAAEVIRGRANGDTDALLVVYVDRDYRFHEDMRKIPISYSGLRIQHALVDVNGVVVPAWVQALPVQTRMSPTQPPAPVVAPAVAPAPAPAVQPSPVPVVLECREADPPPPLAKPLTASSPKVASYLEECASSLVRTPVARATMVDVAELTPFNKILWSDKQEIARLLRESQPYNQWLHDVIVCPYTSVVTILLKDEWVDKNWRDKDIANTLPITVGNQGFVYQVMPRWLQSQTFNTVMPYGVSSPLFLKSILQRMIANCHVEHTVYFNAYLGALIVSVNSAKDLMALRQSVPLTLGIFRIDMAVIDQIYQVTPSNVDIPNNVWGSWRISTSDLPAGMAPNTRFPTRVSAYDYIYANLKPNFDWRVVPVITD